MTDGPEISPHSPAATAPNAQQSTQAAPRTRWTSISNPFAVGLALTLGGLVAFAIGLAVTNLATIWIYIAFAMFAALGLDPLVQWFERHGIKRAWSLVIVAFGFLLLLVGLLALVIPTLVQQVSQFFKDLPAAFADFQKSDVYAWLNNTFGASVPDILSEAQTFLTNPANIATIGGGVLQVGMTIATSISGLIIIIVLSLYFIASLGSIKQAFYRILPARSRETAASMTEEITASIGSYLMGMVVLAFANSIIAFLLHLFLGLPFPLLMAVIAFSITLIPLVGTVAYWVLATSLALFTSPLSALIFGLVYLVYMQIEAYILTPKVMNRAISVPGSLVVIGALVGGTLLGLLGALVAIPVTASALLIIKRLVIPRQDAKV